MMDRLGELRTYEPSDRLDALVRRRVGALPRPLENWTPIHPLERTLYAVVVAVYALYALAFSMRVWRESSSAGASTNRATQGRSPAADPRGGSEA
jgi:hypothetical protein